MLKNNLRYSSSFHFSPTSFQTAVVVGLYADQTRSVRALVRGKRAHEAKVQGVPDEERQERVLKDKEMFRLLYGSLGLNLLCSIPTVLHYVWDALFYLVEPRLRHSVSGKPFRKWAAHTGTVLSLVRLPLTDINGTCGIVCHIVFSKLFRAEVGKMFRCTAVAAVDPETAEGQQAAFQCQVGSPPPTPSPQANRADVGTTGKHSDDAPI